MLLLNSVKLVLIALNILPYRFTYRKIFFVVYLITLVTHGELIQRYYYDIICALAIFNINSIISLFVCTLHVPHSDARVWIFRNKICYEVLIRYYLCIVNK